MKAAIMTMGLAATLVVVGRTDSDGADAGSKVSGALRVKDTKVKTEDPKSQKHVVVYLEKASGAEYPLPPTVHPKMDQRNLVFIPHVMAIQKGTTVDFLNNDTVEHNIFCADDCCKVLEIGETGKSKSMDLGSFGKDQIRSYTFTLAGEAVLLCKLHPEMAAYLIVLDTPYFTVAEIDETTQSATYTIEKVPPGEYVMKVWNKKCTAAEQKVVVSAGQTVSADIELVRKKKQ